MFRTEIPLAPATDQLSRTARVLTVGSCFADSIGARLAANKVETLANPFGTVFQPLALARLLRAAAGEDVDWQQHLVEARGRWQSYDLHGSIGAESPVELLQTIQELVRRTGEFLRQADVVLLTLGTAWAYRLRETGELVNNCHKQSADLFVRELLTPDEIINDLAEMHAYLRRINPELRFVLTVSPVRHLKDTLPMNSVSKSVLRVATHIVSDLLPGVAYFPAYELLLDDLRDYRFYAADMLHPSEVAEDYIWDKFARTYFDADFGRFRKEWAAVRQSLGHRPLHAGAPEHREFLEATLEKLEQLSLRKVGVAAELTAVRTQLAALPVPRPPVPMPVLEDDEERIDIGEGATAADATAVSQPAEAAPPLAESRAPRLSPEEFRAQRSARPERGRRDGRGKGQPALPTENEQFQASPAYAGDGPEIPAVAEGLTPSTSESGLIDLDAQLLSDASAVGGEPVKKKRRSRGGAKRTARKNALRLAAGEAVPAPDSTMPEDAAQSALTGAMEENPDTLPEDGNFPVSPKSEPVQRGGRRNGNGRVPRVELYAAGAPVEAEAVPTVDAELPALALPNALLQVPDGIIEARPTAATPNSRNSRNRNNRRGPGNVTGDEANSAPAEAIDKAAAVVEEAVAAAPVVDTETAASVAPAAARQPRRSKARAVSAARSEKPAVDTPVVPVPDASQLRTQVAAGRMTGSSASLIAPTAAPKKAVTAKVSVVPKKAAVAVVEAPEIAPVAAPTPQAPEQQAPASAVKPKARVKAKAPTVKPIAAKTVAAKATPGKPKPAATPEPAGPEPSPAAVVKPKTASPKPAAKPKAPAAKPAAAKAPAPKKAAAKPAAAKPKPPKKPAKPA